jgi:predicted nuclease of predicted toxin-antitoxin system
VNFLVDMCLPPSWVGTLKNAGWSAVHWSEIGCQSAADAEIVEYARLNGLIILTHDLDFGTLLALTAAAGPSIVQVRSPAVLPRFIGPTVVAALSQFQAELDAGALITIDVHRARVRILPIR